MYYLDEVTSVKVNIDGIFAAVLPLWLHTDVTDLKAKAAVAAPCQILTCLGMHVKMLYKFKAH